MTVHPAERIPVLRTPGKAHIPTAVDQRYRDFLVQRSPKAVQWHMRKALDAGPPRSTDEAYRFFGAELAAVLEKTIPVVIELEEYCPGIQKWLDVTGYGNSRHMIEAFARWAEVGNGLSLS
jgi:hypothetical protein